MINHLHRLTDRLRRFRSLDTDLNDRATVELRLWAVVDGRKPPPDAEECRRLALKLGVPASYRHGP